MLAWWVEDAGSQVRGSGAVRNIQPARQARGQDKYWEMAWDAEQVFYGYVLGFMGLERSESVSC